MQGGWKDMAALSQLLTMAQVISFVERPEGNRVSYLP